MRVNIAVSTDDVSTRWTIDSTDAELVHVELVEVIPASTLPERERPLMSVMMTRDQAVALKREMAVHFT